MENILKDKIDEVKINRIINIILPYYNAEEKSKELENLVANQLKNEFDSINAVEIAYIEKIVRKYDDKSEMSKKDIQRDAFVFEGIFDSTKPVLTSGHPLDNYLRENDQFLERIDRIEELMKDQENIDRDEMISLYDDLLTILIHFQRLHQVLYSELAEKGYDRPFLSLWTLDDYIRDELLKAQELLLSGDMAEFYSMQSTIIYDVRDLLIDKENNNLFPFASALFSDDEFRMMAKSDQKIGYSLIEIDETFRSNSRLVKFNNGIVNVEELSLIFKNLSLDLTYIDENDIIRFYNDDNSFFKKSGKSIGMNIIDFHDSKFHKKLLGLKEKMVRGEVESAKMILLINGRTCLKTFHCVIDKRGNYKGFLDTTQDITDIVGMDTTPRLILPDEK